jgi:hypothetical protein
VGVIYIVTADLLQPRYNILRYGRLTSRHLRLFTRHGGRLGRRLKDKWRKDTCNRICSSYRRKICERSDVTRLHLLLLVVVVGGGGGVPGFQDIVIVMLSFPGQGNRNINGQEMKKDMETETETDKK